MSHPWAHYLIFLLETMTLVISILIVFGGIIAMLGKNKKNPGTLTINNLNDRFKKTKELLQETVLNKKERTQIKKQQKLLAKENKNDEKKKRIFALTFNGDMHASQVYQLREEITALLQIATEDDEVVIKLESPGGVVQGYGLAAAQLARLKERKISLTVCIDKVAASGGYLMACVADQIIAAPFAIVGSLGVIAQIPNFHRLLKKHDIDFEQITAGKYKRTLTMFGENTEKGREKMQADLEEIHHAFKNYVGSYRSSVNLDEVATGEFWLAIDALKLNLVDRIMTSDDYLLYASHHFDVFELNYLAKKTLIQKIQTGMSQIFSVSF
jgi:serine protease SohB